jgi:hypothetical protein
MKRNRLSRAARPTVSGYLPSFLSVDRRGIEPRFPGCKPGVVPLDQQPSFVSAKVPPGVEPGLPPYRGGVPPKHLQTNCQNNPGWNRTIAFLVVTQASSPPDHGIIQVTGVRIELTKSRGSRPRRFSCLRTRPCSAISERQVAGPGVAPGGLSL